MTTSASFSRSRFSTSAATKRSPASRVSPSPSSRRICIVRVRRCGRGSVLTLELVMKCEVCLELLEEYLDGELRAEDQEQINAHLITCAVCSAGLSTLTAEQELFSRYDRELEVPPFLWTRIAQHTVAGSNSIKLGWKAR